MRISYWSSDLCTSDRTIRRLNIVLEQLAPMDLDEPYKSNRMAEARYLRAHAYFNMVKRYGGFPLITRAQQLDDPVEELFPSRNKEAEIYDFIISELDAIGSDLPGDQEGRPSKWAALALKRRAAMYISDERRVGKECVRRCKSR